MPRREQPEIVVSGLPLTGDHPMHPFKIDADGHIYVDLGSATNACQVENRVKGSPGHEPCTELETRAGVWRYDANKTDQHFSPAERYATGIRNGEGFAFDSAGRLFVTQHGRDQLSQNWPNLYKMEQSAELPAEEVVQVEQGGDYGWPECYFDGAQKKLVLAPEYGGDGGTKVGVCAEKKAPVAFFPAHWAPNDLLIYTGKAFPTSTRAGPSLPSTGRGIALLRRKVATTSSFSLSRTARPVDLPSPLRMVLPGHSRSPAGRHSVRPGSQWDRTARSTFRTTSAAASGG